MPYCSACGASVLFGGSHSCRKYNGGVIIDDTDPVQMHFVSPERLMTGWSGGTDDEDIAGIFDDPDDIRLAEALSLRMVDTGAEDCTVEFVHLPHELRQSGPTLWR